MDHLRGAAGLDRRQLREEGLGHRADKFVVVATRHHDDPVTRITAVGAVWKGLEHAWRKRR
jgi:hypothetical protein